MDVQVNKKSISLNDLSSFTAFYVEAYESYKVSLYKRDEWHHLEKNKLIYQYKKSIDEDKLKKYSEWEQRAKRIYYDHEEHTIISIRKIVNKLSVVEHKEIERYILSNEIFKDAIKKKNILSSDLEEIILARFIYMIYMMKSGKAITFRTARNK